jgi:hypothetical protein
VFYFSVCVRTGAEQAIRELDIPDGGLNLNDASPRNNQRDKQREVFLRELEPFQHGASFLSVLRKYSRAHPMSCFKYPV